jgi:hypothetical protein
MNKFTRTSFLLCLMVSLFASCEKPDISDDQDLVNDLYTRSADTLTIGTDSYFLETFLNRNFMPGAFKDRSLLTIAYLVNADSLPLVKNFAITQLYVIKSGLVWISSPDVIHDPYLPQFKLEYLSNDGPEWETGIYVDVVAEVLYTNTKDRYLVIARHQYIERSD